MALQSKQTDRKMTTFMNRLQALSNLRDEQKCHALHSGRSAVPHEPLVGAGDTGPKLDR